MNEFFEFDRIKLYIKHKVYPIDMYASLDDNGNDVIVVELPKIKKDKFNEDECTALQILLLYGAYILLHQECYIPQRYTILCILLDMDKDFPG